MRWKDGSKLSVLNRAYGVEPIDYGPRRGNDLLIAIGSGLMMAAMDLMPSCRYAIDLGGGQKPRLLGPWLEGVSRLVDRVVVVAWYSISDPDVLRRALRGCEQEKVFVYCNVSLGVGQHFQDLEALAMHMNDLESKSLAHG